MHHRLRPLLRLATALCRRALLTILVLLAATMLAACGGNAVPQAQQVVVVDLSSSAESFGAVIAHELESSVRSAADGKAVLTVLPVTVDSLGDTRGVVEVDFDAPLPDHVPDNDLFRERYQEQRIAETLTRLQQWQEEQALSTGSDYHGALVRVGQVLDDARGPATVTVIGDGFSTNLLDIKPGMDPADCGDLATAAAELDRLPDLTGVEFHWVGGGRTDTPLAPVMQAGLEDCWERVVHALGGETPAGWWAPATFNATAKDD